MNSVGLAMPTNNFNLSVGSVVTLVCSTSYDYVVGSGSLDVTCLVSTATAGVWSQAAGYCTRTRLTFAASTRLMVNSLSVQNRSDLVKDECLHAAPNMPPSATTTATSTASTTTSVQLPWWFYVLVAVAGALVVVVLVSFLALGFYYLVLRKKSKVHDLEVINFGLSTHNRQ